MNYIHTATQFYYIRFLLGVAEAGFFPGAVVYLNHWFRYQDKAKAVALFMAAIPVSNIVGSPISGLILGFNWLGLVGWRWLFIIEGIPAIVFGIITIFYITDWPHQANWLLSDEREWIKEELKKEKQIKEVSGAQGIWSDLKQRKVILLTVALFFVVNSFYRVLKICIAK